MAQEIDLDITQRLYYGARYYNPRVSIWYGVDPLAEAAPSWSPYVYTMENPIKYIDLTGMITEDPGDDTYIYKNKKGEVTRKQVVNTGNNTPNRLFVQDVSANKNTKNRKSHGGAYFEIQMIPSSEYSEKDHEASMTIH